MPSPRGVRHAGFRAVSARIFRVYGRGSKDVISRWVRAALNDEAVEVYHPENRFDYVYSGDVADGLIQMAFDPGARGIVNLGTSVARRVSEVIEVIESATGRPLRATMATVDEPFEASCADVARLRRGRRVDAPDEPGGRCRPAGGP